jgi:SAM-dependent methyltransferase
VLQSCVVEPAAKEQTEAVKAVTAGITASLPKAVVPTLRSVQYGEMAESPQPYSAGYYRWQSVGASASAAEVVPIFLKLFPVRSVIDVGCGTGAWARQFLVNGVPQVLGIDGDYVDPTQLLIPAECFVEADLCQPIRISRGFDAAVCLEVAEHLPESRAIGLVYDLTLLAPCILFSAAVPGQGGTNHINEQYLSFWINLFQEHQYEAMDAIRPSILGNNSVEWWYQQNTVVFAGPGHPLRSRGFARPQNIIHQQLYDSLRYRLSHPGARTLLAKLPMALARSIRSRVSKLGKQV